MSLMFYLTICFVQILLLANAMEEDQDFEPFLSIRLPYSVKRDEVVKVPCLVYNFFHKDLDVQITLDNSDGKYENIDFDNKVISEPKLTKSIRVRGHATARVAFLIRPKVIGKVMLKFNASSLADFDIIHKVINVVPEGIIQYESHDFLINLEKKAKQRYEFEMDIPVDLLVPGSQHIEVGFVGDIMGLVLNNLVNLVGMPAGCGEQTMSSLLPNYLIMKYYVNSNRLTHTIKAKLRHNLETGYQNMLNYRHMDGSFSSFGPSQATEEPRNGSTWLTALFLRFLPQIKEFVNVNRTIIKEGLAFLSIQQADNGAFTEKGDSQRDHITITVAAVLAFLRNPAYANKYSREITNGLKFIAKNLEKYKSLHAHSVAKYASNKSRHQITKIMSLTKWLSETNLANQSKWWHYEFITDVEFTSHNIITILEVKSINDVHLVPIIKRLIAQRNRLGNFAKTQDTIIDLINLINSAQEANYEPGKMDVDIVSRDKNETIKLCVDNEILYRSVELPPKTKLITINANGTGSALVQFSLQYNLIQEVLKPSFTIKINKRDNENRLSRLEMLVCVNYVGKGQSSNMALLEISTPSGYVIDGETLKEMEKLKRVTYTELKNADSLLVVYFDHLYKNDETCLTVEALRTHAVAMQKPSLIRLYEYYDTDRQATAFYDVDLKLCDICDTDEECRKCK